ncbi:uncharacterized protein LOC134240756 [Saccostrea cucullata]|uniref:uncharacterized protein LOC134240756 n=1 Tax=Saccostrea cuccullata TaxID=36930 RepID=UPI002ED34A35
MGPYKPRSMGSKCCRHGHPTDINLETLWEANLENLYIKTPSLLSFVNESDDMMKDVFLGDENRCFICLENYNDQQNQPIIMPCGHIVCNKCLIQLAKTFQYEELKCPLDNKIHKVKRSKRGGHQDQASILSQGSSVVREAIPVEEVDILSQRSSAVREAILVEEVPNFMSVGSSSSFNGEDVPPSRQNVTDERKISVTHVPQTQHVTADVHDDNGLYVNSMNQLFPNIPLSTSRVFGRDAAKNQHSRNSFSMSGIPKHSSPGNIRVNISNQNHAINVLNSSMCYNDDWILEPKPDYPSDSSEDEDMSQR